MTSHHRITDHDHEALLKSAVQVEPFRGDRDPRIGGDGYTHTIKKKIHVPVEKDVKVPVVKRTVESQMERHLVQGTKMVPVKKYRDVQETIIETKEEVVEGFRERWVKIKEPTREVVKKQIPVTRTKRVPYVDYIEEKVEKVVEVPKDVVKEKRGYRVDKHIGTKVVEVEEDHHYEMRPVYVKKGDTRLRETGEFNHHGKAKHGRSAFEGGEERIVGGGISGSRVVSSGEYYSGSRAGGGGEYYAGGGGEYYNGSRAMGGGEYYSSSKAMGGGEYYSSSKAMGGGEFYSGSKAVGGGENYSSRAGGGGEYHYSGASAGEGHSLASARSTPSEDFFGQRTQKFAPSSRTDIHRYY